jgi:hypothetical protein
MREREAERERGRERERERERGSRQSKSMRHIEHAPALYGLKH